MRRYEYHASPNVTNRTKRLFSWERKYQDSDQQGQDRKRAADFEVLEKAYLHFLFGGFQYNEVRHGSDDREISGERGGHRHRQPKAVGRAMSFNQRNIEHYLR